MIGVEIVKDKLTKEPGPQETTEVRQLCADHGLIVGKGGWWNNVIRIQPPLIITPEHAYEALDIFELAVQQVAKGRK
jgi:4-aminobutyrate aminotransferase-like enzyme